MDYVWKRKYWREDVYRAVRDAGTVRSRDFNPSWKNNKKHFLSVDNSQLYSLELPSDVLAAIVNN